MKQYIDSQEHWEDSVNASHEHQKEMEREHQKQIEKQISEQPTQEESFISSNLPVSGSKNYASSVYECIMCGEILDHCGKLCSDECAEDYRYENRTCSTCGGEFWDGGTSCTCDDE